jgi:acetyl-CoA C-acetyltransferase
MQREDDPTVAVEALELMVRAAHLAGDDARTPSLLSRVGWIGTPGGNWSYPDPGRLVAAALGSSTPHTVVSEIGILQQDLITRAVHVVARGDVDAALVVGGEARYREQQAMRVGIEVLETPQPGAVPDEAMQPETLGIADLEIVRNTVAPVVAYALIEDAIRVDAGQTVDVHRDQVADLWHRFALVAADNPDAWDRSAPSARAIRESAPDNRMIAFPYTKRHASQWNVDQAAALLVCSVEAARAAGVPEDCWVFPWGAAVTGDSVPVVQRSWLHRSPGTAMAIDRLRTTLGIEPGSWGPVDLYSCFPAAVQVQAAETAIALDPAPTLTGGMTFAGGPLNNYALQAMVALVAALRAQPGAVGLSSSVSGFLHKVGFGVWSSSPPPRPFAAHDVTDEASALAPPRPLVDGQDGSATVVAATVDRSWEPRAVAVCELADGSRTIALSSSPEVCAAVEQGSLDRSIVVLRPGGELNLP